MVYPNDPSSRFGCLAILLFVCCCLIGLWYWSVDRTDITENNEQKQAKSTGPDKDVEVTEKKTNVEVELKEEEKKTPVAKLKSKTLWTNFSKIERGWSVKDVTDTIGLPTQTTYQGGFVVRVWQDESTVVRIQFQNNRVWTKHISD